MRPGLACNACNTQFSDETAQKAHYRSDWHQYNLRRKVAGLPGITEDLFNLRLEAVAAEKRKLEAGSLLVYKCALCNKEYRSSKAHAQHLTSKQHIQKASGHPNISAEEITVTRQASEKNLSADLEKRAWRVQAEEEDSSDEWEEVTTGEDDYMVVDGLPRDDQNGTDEIVMSEEDIGEWDATQCFFCDLKPDKTIESCVMHMHKEHGFFIPDSEHLKDPRGLLNYLGLKVTKGLMCLYCDGKGKQFHSLEAVRKHMISRSHCKIQYGNEDVDEELEDFYDFSSSYTSEEGFEMMVAEVPPIELSTVGSELIIRQEAPEKHSVKIIGSREFARYYKQRPRPSDSRDAVLVNSIVARYRNMGLVTGKSRVLASNSNERRNSAHIQAETMRTKVGMKNNVIRNLPKNVPY
ncbi:hypothetical protein KP509_1Z001300 [Ceratopteris richardii]|nr:hypothetical protein KP509_1Z001300 [Ceratopteris richardii]